MNEIAYEPFDPKFRDRPIDHYTRLRADAPIYRSPAGYWVFTRYDDVQTILRDADTYSSKIVGTEAMSQGDGSVTLDDFASGSGVDLGDLIATPSIVATDPPKHGALRQLVNRAFMPKRLAQWDDYVATATTECLRDVRPDRGWDVLSQLAMPLPVAVISEILGVDRDMRARIKTWSDIIIQTGQGARRGTSEAQRDMLGMLRDFSAYFAPIIEERRRNPREDMISDLVRAEERDTLTSLDTLIFIMSLMVAGNETTTNLIGNAVVSFLENPDQLAKVQADRSLLKNAIEETLRYRTPVQFGIRTPTRDVVFGGHKIRVDDPMVVVLGSANRDPTKFPEPDRFDVTRDFTSPHLSFGHGIHFCIGFHLARREAMLALGAILDDLHKWKLPAEPLIRIDSNLGYGYTRIELQPA